MPLTIDIVTPERVVMQTQADAVIVPAAEGEMGIWPKHAPLLAELQAGSIRLKREQGTELFAISGGFVEVLNDRVTVLAETAEQAREIDEERARHAAEKARAKMKTPLSAKELMEVEASLRKALVRLHAVDSYRHRNPAGR